MFGEVVFDLGIRDTRVYPCYQAKGTNSLIYQKGGGIVLTPATLAKIPVLSQIVKWEWAEEWRMSGWLSYSCTFNIDDFGGPGKFHFRIEVEDYDLGRHASGVFVDEIRLK